MTKTVGEERTNSEKITQYFTANRDIANMEPSKEANGHPRPLDDVAGDQYSALPTSGKETDVQDGGRTWTRRFYFSLLDLFLTSSSQLIMSV